MGHSQTPTLLPSPPRAPSPGDTRGHHLATGGQRLPGSTQRHLIHRAHPLRGFFCPGNEATEQRGNPRAPSGPGRNPSPPNLGVCAPELRELLCATRSGAGRTVSPRDGRRDSSIMAGAQISSHSPIKRSLETAGATQGTGTTMAPSQPGAPSPSQASSRLL